MTTRNIVTEGLSATPNNVNERFGGVYVVGTGASSEALNGVFGDGSTDDASALNTLANTTIDSDGGVIEFLEGEYVIGSSLTFPANVELRFRPDAVLKPSSGVTVTINGPVSAGLWQVFNASSGSFSFGSGVTETFYPQWFGAVADGSTDDITPFTAMDAAVPAGAKIVIPEGTYALSKQWDITTNDLTIEGVSWRSRLRPQSGVARAPLRAVAVTGVTIRNLRLSGRDVADASDDNTSCLVVRGDGTTTSQDCVVEYCWLDGAREHGINISDVDRLTIRYNRIDGIDPTSAESGSADIHGTTDQGNIENVKIIGNECLSTTIRSTHILLISSNNDVDIADNLIFGNTCAGGTQGASNTGHGVVLYVNDGKTGNTVSGNRIVNNLVRDVPNIGIYIQGGDLLTTARDNLIANNYIRDAVLDGSSGTLSDAAIVAKNAPFTSIVGNVLVKTDSANNSSTLARGIVVAAAPDCTVVGNVVRGAEFTGHGIYGFSVSSDAPDRCIIQGNIVHDIDGNAIRFDSGDDVKIVANVVKQGTQIGINVDGNRALVADNEITVGSGVNPIVVRSNATDTRIRDNTGLDDGNGLNDNGTRTRVNGIGVESANAETPTAANWDVGDIVDFTDSGDASGDGQYLLLTDGSSWAQIA